MFNNQLFEGQNIYLTAIDVEADPIIESDWTMEAGLHQKVP